MSEAPTREKVIEALRNCYDPEIPVNIVDLGLIYNVSVNDGSVNIKMTLTAQGCPAHTYLSQQVKGEIEKLPGVKKAEVEIVWDPPWTPDRMSDAARKRLQAGYQEPVTVEINPHAFKPRKKGHLVKNPDGTIILINERNLRYKVNDDIVILWTKSQGAKTTDELTSEIAAELKVSPAEISNQIVEILRKLIAIGLIAQDQPDLLPLQP